MASGRGEAPPDGDDEPSPERQPEWEGDNLRLFYPLRATFYCCERGCQAACNPEVWTSRRQSLQRHLETEHGACIRSTISICNICDEVLGPRPTTHRCLVRRLAAAPPPPAHQAQEGGGSAGQAGHYACRPWEIQWSSAAPSPTQGSDSSLAALTPPVPSPPQSPAPEVRPQEDCASPPTSGPDTVSWEPAALPEEPDVRHLPATSPAALEGGERSPAPPAEESPGGDPSQSPVAGSISTEQQPTHLQEQHALLQAEPAGP
ncbi:hypothetical protein HPB50_011521 [Hyalomma asiaticum]|uniref:Uncharacterized protein n=1 Tax=Hyalomma asiaticum TaxID=266040 RepID=A0ACB7T9G5_HYAAI|nr:hypothetical protein HPB50_011521 [Hyalomma asiaticum]